MFVHVETRRRQHVQWATALLVVVCVVSFVGLALMPAPQRMSMWLEWGTVPANIFDAKQPILPQLHDPALLRLCIFVPQRARPGTAGRAGGTNAATPESEACRRRALSAAASSR